MPLYFLIFSASVADVNDGKDHDIADHGKDPGNDKAQDQIHIRRMHRINGCHPDGAQAKHPNNRVHGAPDGVTKGLDRVAENGVHRRKYRCCGKHIVSVKRVLYGRKVISQEKLHPIFVCQNDKQAHSGVDNKSKPDIIPQ